MKTLPILVHSALHQLASRPVFLHKEVRSVHQREDEKRANTMISGETTKFGDDFGTFEGCIDAT
jgi:hypothetical protein